MRKKNEKRYYFDPLKIVRFECGKKRKAKKSSFFENVVVVDERVRFRLSFSLCFLMKGKSRTRLSLSQRRRVIALREEGKKRTEVENLLHPTLDRD